jgi:hypothetical protein
MTPTQRRVITTIPFALLLAIFFAGFAPARALPSGESTETDSSQPEARPPHESVAVAIEKAFAHNDARLLRSVLPKRSKVYLSTLTLGIEDGYYGPDQLIALLDRIFRLRPTRRFTWEPPRASPSDQPVSLTAVWRYRPKGGSRSSIRLRFVVAPGSSGWSVREIRESK